MTAAPETWSVQLRDLHAGDSITTECDACQSSVTWTKAELVLAVGGGTELHNVGLHERLRCRGCGQAPSSAWPSWQPR
jgi:hypothetical protein